ncbi:MAG: bifunctional diguanylate cyclase/phosphodiesterase, partial [Gammaproteobacteria bacterium]
MKRFSGFDPRNSFRSRLVYVTGGIGLAMTLSLSYWVGSLSVEQVKQDKGTLMQELAAQMSREMDKGIFDRRREIGIVASLRLLRDASVEKQQKRALLESLQASYRHYAWIGFTDREGTIQVGTQGLLEGKNVKARNWFINGSKAPSVGDVHDAFLLAKILPKPVHDFLPLRLLDVSAPIKDDDGRLVGVLCGHLSWDWAFEVRNSLLEPLKATNDVDVLIFNRTDGLLLGTPQLAQLKPEFELPSLNNADASRQGYLEEDWPDGHRYLTGYYHSQGFADYPGLDWSVLVRQPAARAYAPALALQQRTFASTALFSFAFLTSLWFISNRLVRPMRMIAVNADKIRGGTLSIRDIPVFEGRDETAVMSHSLARLVTTLDLKNQELKLAAQVFNSSTEGIVITDADDIILTINRAYSDITGYSVDEVLGKKPSILSSGVHPHEFYRDMWDKILKTGHWTGEVLNRRKNGEFYPEWLTITTVYDDAGTVTHYVGIFNDITERKAAEEKIRFLAHHDSLTSLPNRLVFEDRLAEALKRAKNTRTMVAVLFADLNRFKNINDSLGHPIGDIVLQQIASRLITCIGKKDTVARFGGDEFIVIMPDLKDAEQAGAMAQRVVDHILPTLYVDDYQLHVSVSIGISLYPHDGDTPTTLVKNADTAMYHAKEFENHAYRFFTSDLNHRVSERLNLENALHRALDKQELYLVYQPQFELATQRVTGAEVLLRWQHPELGAVSPA